MLKRVSAVLLAVVMMVSMICSISVANAAEENYANLVAVPDKETVKRGEDVTFTVSIETTDVKLSGLGIQIEADSDLVFKSWDPAAAGQNDLLETNLDEKKIGWATGNEDGELVFAGNKLCTVTYTVKAEATLGEAGITVEAFEAAYNDGNTTKDCVDLVGAVAKDITVACAHDFTGAWVQPADGTAKEDAMHTRECGKADCQEREEEACQFSQTGVTKHTDLVDGAVHWECDVCGYTCDTPILAGHDITLRYKAATATKDGRWEEYCSICEEPVSTTPITAGWPFNDMAKKGWTVAPLRYMHASGLMEGSGGNFTPNANMDRAQVMVVLARIYYGGDANVPKYNASENVFADIDSYSWKGARKYIQACQKAGIVEGTESGGKLYCNPKGLITTQEVATMFYRTYKLKYGNDPIQFVENPVSYESIKDRSSVASWARTAVKWSVNSGLLQGDNGYLRPKANLTRAQMATMLMRYDTATRGIVIL